MHEPLHLANITIHIGFGAVAFFLGALVLLRPKGDRTHRLSGRVFAILVTGVIATAGVGFGLFRPDPTLGAVTLLVSYQLFSGLRAARGGSPTAMDTGIAVLAFAAGGAFLIYLSSGAGAYWRPQVTFPIGVTLLLVACYDLARIAFPLWRARIFPVEHGVKMIMVLSALASAGSGTVFASWQPLSQIGPSVFFSFVALGYVWLRGASALRLART